MRTRTQLFVSALVASAAMVGAIPAQAQYNPHHNYPQQSSPETQDGRYDNRENRYDRNDQYRGNANAIATQIDQLQRRVARSDGRDRISEREAAGLRNAVYQLRIQFRDYNRNGLSQREARYLQDRINLIRSRLQYERQDNNGRRY